MILEPQLKQYRHPFLLALAARLREHDIELRVAYSAPTGGERAKSDTIELDRDLGERVPHLALFGGRVVIQRAWTAVRDADLVILEQGNKHLFNYVMLALSGMRRQRVAYWGHGYNRQAVRPGVSEWLKRRLLTRVDWWFAYTHGVARYLIDQGVPAHTITEVQNTIDTRELIDAIEKVSSRERAELRHRLGIAPTAPIALYCGSLYAEKRLDFLLDAVHLIRRSLPDFELIVVGDGPERHRLDALARSSPFVHVVGGAFGDARAAYFAISSVFLMPALLGVAIVDAFAAGLPVITTELPTHGPEIEYLEPDHNGFMSPWDVAAYASRVVEVLRAPARLQALQAGARASAARLTLPHMVDAFAGGIVGCLAGATAR